MYELIFYLTAAIALGAAAMVLLLRHPMHAALYLVVSLLALALLFYLLGAPLVAALQVIVYAGAIMILFLFIIMIMNLRPGSDLLALPRRQPLPFLLALLLAAELALLLAATPSPEAAAVAVPPKAVGLALFGPYLPAVEIVAIMLLAALVAALCLSRNRHT